MDRMFEIAVRLTTGEVIEAMDDAGRVWRATPSSLACVVRGESCAVLEDVGVYEVAGALLDRIGMADDDRGARASGVVRVFEQA